MKKLLFWHVPAFFWQHAETVRKQTIVQAQTVQQPE